MDAHENANEKRPQTLFHRRFFFRFFFGFRFLRGCHFDPVFGGGRIKPRLHGMITVA